MKTLLSILLLFIASVSNTLSQKKARPDYLKSNPMEKALGQMSNQIALAMPIKDVIKQIGKDIYVYETILGYQVINDSLKLLYVGGIYPKHKMTMIIKGRKVIEELLHLRNGAASHFGGTALMYKGKPAIIITHSSQTGIRILI